MVDNDVDSLICNTAQIRGEEEKDTFNSFSSSSTKSSCKSGSSDDSYLDKADRSYIEDEVAVDTVTIKPSKTSLFCSVPLNRIGAVLGYNSNKIEAVETSAMKIKQTSRKLLCLYCDRTFVSSNLRQKHVERCHSEKQSRRLSSRKLQSQFTTTACCYCDKLPTEHSLRQLFDHLISDHSERYFGCLSCEERFLNQSLLNDHNANVHSDFSMQRRQKTSRLIEIQKDLEKTDTISDQTVDNYKESNQKLTRSVTKEKDPHLQSKPSMRQLRNKKIAIKASKIGLKRSKRLQAAQAKVSVRKKRSSTFESVKLEETTSKSPEKAKNLSVNPYPEFDNYYRVKKITDHSIDNLKISSLTFDDVFDKAFFSRIKCNIQENLMYHLDGKLFKNEESENRISNFEKNPPPHDVPSTSSENFGCDLTLNALTPVTSILTPHFGEDLESQIEYGSKPSKKKLQPRQDPVRHKYVTRRKYQASILEHKENRDLSKLDMWTQIIIKDRQQKVMNDQKSAKEMLEYTTCEEYKLKVQRNELNRILDRRGPFEDLREEASKKAALDNLNSEFANQISEECFKEVRSLMDDLLNEVVKVSLDNGEHSDNIVKLEEEESFLDKVDIPEFPEYLKLQRASSLLKEEEIDKSDKIALICSSQETENYELPTNKVRAKNEMVELSGEWARSRIYVCAACGLKVPNMKILLEHKTLDHQYSWVQHYELVGNQSKLYRHLCIPGLGKVGHVEDTVQCKIWRRSEARVCTKCGKVCNTLGELHRHILECGGDWTWMLARKKCKYRPFGSRKKRRGLVKRIRERNQKTEQTEKKKYKKRFEGPRQRPSDADTIQRMLANLPPKRSSRKSICMKDGFPRNLNKSQNNKKQVMKCGKIVMKKSTYNSSESKETKTSTNHKRTLRSLNRTLSSKILDTNNKLRVKRQLMKNIRRSTRKAAISASYEDKKVIIDDVELKDSNTKIAKGGKVKNENGKNRITNILQEKLNIKSFFPVSKRKLTKNNTINNMCEPQNSDSSKEKTISEGKKFKGSIKKLIKKSLNFKKKAAADSESTDKLRVSSEPIVVIEKLQQSTQKTTNPKSVETSTLSSKRKLRSSFRKVIDKVKKLKIDNSSSSLSSAQNKPTSVKSLNSFLGQGAKEKEKLPTVLVPLVEEPKENPPSTPAFVQNVMNSNSPTEESLIPENIFNLEHNSENLLQAKSPLENTINELRNNEAKNAFETFAATKGCSVETDKKQKIIYEAKPSTLTAQATNSLSNILSKEEYNILPSKEMSLLTIETSVKSDKSPLLSPVLSPSALSPKMKGRLRKPSRGLNDCIAMLTKKAFEVETYKSDSSTNENCLGLQEKKPILDNKNVAHKFVRPNECILKIPVFETESNKNVQSEVLDLSKPKQKINEEIGGTKEDAIDLSTLKMPFWESSIERNHFPQSKNTSVLSTTKLDDFWKPMYTMQTVISNSISEKPILKIPKFIETSWTTVDDIIQRVVENRCESSISRNTSESRKSHLKIPLVGATNSVDAIIEEVVRGKMGYLQIDKSKNNKRLDPLVESTQKENKILNSKPRKKFNKLTKKDSLSSINIENKSISFTATKTHENVNILTNNEDNVLPNINKLNTIKTDASSLSKHSRTSDDSSFQGVSNLEEEQSDTCSKEKNEICAVVDRNVPMKVQITDITNKAIGSTVSSNSGDQNSNQGLMDVEPMMVSSRKYDENVEQVNQSPIELRDSIKVEENVKINSVKESHSDHVTENIDVIQKNPIQEMHSGEAEEISLSTKNVSDTIASKDTGSMKSSPQILNYVNDEIQSSIMDVTVGTEGEAIEEYKKDGVFSNISAPENNQIINCYEDQQSDLYSTPEDEPIILEEKDIFEDSKKSTSTDSEDDLPLVIFKAKSKNISTTPLVIVTNENTLKSFESEPTGCASISLDNTSDVSTELSGSSLTSKRNTTKFSSSIVKESSTNQSNDKEVSEPDENIIFEEEKVELQQIFDRRRSTRKSSATKKSPETTTEGTRKTKSKYGKSKYNTKKISVINLKNEIADVNYNNKTSEKLTDKLPNNKFPIHTDHVISNDSVITETAVVKHVISEEDLISKCEGESKIRICSDIVKPLHKEMISKNNETLNTIPIFKISKLKFHCKDKDKNKTLKSKLILKLPKIVLKEPTLKLPFAENVLEKKLMKKKNDSNTDEIKNLNENIKQSSLKDDFIKINESVINSQDLIEKTELMGIKLKLKTKAKKKNNKFKRDSFSSNENQDKIKTLSCEADEASVLLSDISKTLNNDPNISSNLAIPMENTFSKEIPEFVYDKSGVNESKKSSSHNTIFSLSKFKSLDRCKQKIFGNKKKKVAKAETQNISSSPASSDICIETSPVDSVINTTPSVIEDEIVESNTITDLNQLSSSESTEHLNVKISNHKNKVKKKPKKHKIKTNERIESSLLSSFSLSESDSTFESSNNVKSLLLETNQSVMPSVNKSLICGNIDAYVSTEKSKAVIETRESNIFCGSNESISKSNVDETTTKYSEVVCKDNNKFDTITESSLIGDIDTKPSKNISMQTVVDEKKETSNSKTVRSLRSTVKITYKQSNIFELQVENRENIDLKIKDNLKHSSNESIPEVSYSSEVSSSNKNHDEIIQQPADLGLEDIKISNLEKNNTLLFDASPSLLFDSTLNMQAIVSLNNLQKEKVLNKTVDIKKQKKNRRTRYSDMEDKAKNTSAKEIENLNATKNSSNIVELHSEFLVPVCNSENLGNNGINLKPIKALENYLTESLKNPPMATEILKSIEYKKEMANVNNEPLSEDAVVFLTEEELPPQNEIKKKVDFAELPPVILKNEEHISQVDCPKKIDMTEQFAEKDKRTIQKELSKLTMASDEEMTELDDLSLAELQALSVGGFNLKNELKVSNKNNFSFSHKKKESKTENIENNSRRLSNDDLYHLELMKGSKIEKGEIQLTTVKSFVHESTEILNTHENSLSNLDLYSNISQKDVNIEIEENNPLVDNESSSIKCVLDTKKNGSHSQAPLKQIGDVFEIRDNLISNVKLNSEFVNDQNTKNHKSEGKNIFSSSICSENELTGVSSDLPISHVDEFVVDLKSIDVNPIRRSRTAKVRALENINILENTFDNAVVPQDANYSENEVSSKKKKIAKLAGNSKHVKNDEANIGSEFIAPRRNRTAKAKALENICNLEKIGINNGDKERRINDIVENLNDSICSKSDSNDGLLLSPHFEISVSNSLKHIDAHHKDSSEFRDTSGIEEIGIQNVDNVNQNDKYFPTPLHYNVSMSPKNENVTKEEDEAVQSYMNKNALFNSSNNSSIMTSDEVFGEVKSDSIANIDEHDRNSESLTKDDKLLENEKDSVTIDKDNIDNNLTLSEIKNQENRSSFIGDIIPSRKNRLAKSKALENINELKMKTDNVDFEADILKGKNDRIEKNSKKSKSRKLDNCGLFDEKMSIAVSKGLHENIVYSENLIFYNPRTKGADKSESITDCYDISKIDDDDNLNQNDLIIFSPKKNKAIKSKVLQTKKNVHNNDASTTEENKLEVNLADKSEQISTDVELENSLLSQKLDCLDELKDSFQISSVLEATANEILKEDRKEKRNKKIPVKKQNFKKSTKHVESSKLIDCFIDTEETLLNKSSEMESEIEGSLTENESVLNKEDIGQATTKKRISECCQEDEITRSEAENKRRRRACRVNTYNENDLAEAIFMQAPVQKEKEKTKKKRLEANMQQASTSLKMNEKKNSRASEKLMNSDELFDLLKATSVENPGKSSEQTFSGTVDQVHNNFNDDNFNNVFDDILKKSQALFGEKSKIVGSNKLTDMCRSADTSDNIENFKNFTKTKNSSLKSLGSYSQEEIKISGQATISQNDKSKSDDSEDLFCDICKKSFKRIDNLVKHRTTLTHISKLSEIEAKQAEDKLKQIEQVTENSTNIFLENEIPKPSQVESLYSYSPSKGNDALKIAEIITNSFEKPSLHLDKNLSEMVPPSSEYRRYKSLGERKSFESDQGSSNISDNVDTNIYESHIPNNAGVILEKQITLLQNIIENRALDYIDDMSISSYHSLENTNITDNSVTAINSKVDSSRNFIFPKNAGCMPYKKTEPESFLKPPQVEDISEDSVNLKNSEDVKSRKVLNRDEELFLECCSLLKSGSEVSNFSKKSNRTVLNNIALKTSDEPDIFESKVLIDKREESSDYSRIATPLGDSFGDTSNSNTVLSNWSLNKENKEENIDQKESNYFNFKGANEESFHSSKFSNLVSKTLQSTSKDTSKIMKNRKQPSPFRVEDEEVDPDSSSKMPTKGALKVFEGLKVSISTVELNLEGVLNNSPPIKKVDLSTPEKNLCEKQFSSPKTPRSSRKSKPVKNKQQLDDRFIFKVKKKPSSKECEKAKLELAEEEASDKIPDVYDFEETQDNTDVFVKPDFKTFRTKGVEEPRNENIFENNYEGHTLSSSSSSTNSLCKKPKTNECITKKKHMIMGRIFKNAVKPKVDEDIRDIPNIDHNELVENYVLSCTPKLDEEFKKPKMTEEEMNSLFDKLLDKPVDPSKKQNVQNKLDLKSTGLKKKFKIKCKKRHRTNSDSTDDEFGLNRIVRKKPSRKNAKEEDNSINLEQELKECIGVASRKSQRKCTSGKQNVLVEYWSSDESAFEAFLENHLQELSSRTDLLEQPKENHNSIEQKIEEENPIAKITNSKIHSSDKETKIKSKKLTSSKKKNSCIDSPNSAALSQPVAQINRRKRAAAHPLYHWSSSSEDETQDLIEVKSIRDDNDDEYDEDRPIQHGWIVGDSPKKLVTMLAQAKGKKTESESSVKEQGKKKNSNS